MIGRRGFLAGLAAALATPAAIVRAFVPRGPRLVQPPVITGSAVVGEPLVVSPGVWSEPGVTFTRQWLRDGVPISEAAEYVMQPGDEGRIRLRITAKNERSAGV